MRFVDERQSLAAAFRWAARLGWQSGICNHFSLAVDDRHVLINPQGYLWSELRASDLVLLDENNAIVEGQGSVEETAFFVHLPIHRRLPSARCVVHAHTPYVTALACSENGRLEMCHQDAMRFHDRIVYDDEFNGAVRSDAEGERIAAALGNRQIMLMAHHGATVVGDSVAQAFDDFYYLENACRFQVLAMSMNRPLRKIAPAVMEQASGSLADPDQVAGHFSAIMRTLDREEPDYRS